MKIRQTLLPVVATCAALLALPSAAFAGEWTIDPENGKLPLAFSIASGTAKFNTRLGLLTCTSSTGSGTYTSGTTGNLSLSFKGCTNFHGASCITEFENLDVHNIMIDGTPSPIPGILITPHPTTNVFAETTCWEMLPGRYKGNGLIARISDPTCAKGAEGKFQKTATLNLEQVSGAQKYMQITTTGTKYDLTLSEATAAWEVQLTITFSQGARMTCP